MTLCLRVVSPMINGLNIKANLVKNWENWEEMLIKPKST